MCTVDVYGCMNACNPYGFVPLHNYTFIHTVSKPRNYNATDAEYQQQLQDQS
eukprot:m.116415 g.116415  ORF g.116415 m.116415 type:complete len:52 (-) comp13609_c3_seq1:186-341(-)